MIRTVLLGEEVFDLLKVVVLIFSFIVSIDWAYGTATKRRLLRGKDFQFSQSQSRRSIERVEQKSSSVELGKSLVSIDRNNSQFSNQSIPFIKSPPPAKKSISNAPEIKKDLEDSSPKVEVIKDPEIEARRAEIERKLKEEERIEKEKPNQPISGFSAGRPCFNPTPLNGLIGDIGKINSSIDRPSLKDVDIPIPQLGDSGGGFNPDVGGEGGQEGGGESPGPNIGGGGGGFPPPNLGGGGGFTPNPGGGGPDPILADRDIPRDPNAGERDEKDFIDKKEYSDEELVPNPNNVKITEFEKEVVRLTNKARVERGLSILAVRENIMDSSRESSDLMKPRGKLTHGLTSGWRRENIAYGYGSPEKVVNGWINSPGHYKNMMAKEIKYIGVGDTSGKNGSIYWTQQFI